MNLAEILSGAVFTAFHEPPRENWKGRGNSWRAHAFVKEVANQFRALLPCTSHRVFSRDFEYPEQEFGYNEFLYDIAVCEVGKITFGNSNRITFAKKAVWLIESEMSNRAADVIADFSKLVIGAAENKLFIGSKQWKDCLEPCAEACNGGRVFLAVVPHPNKWTGSRNEDISVWEYKNKDGWVQCNGV